MGSKLDDLRKNESELTASLGAGRAPGVPLGMDGPVSLSPRVQGLARDKRLNRIPVARIVADPEQPRKDFAPEAIDRLAESLKAKGQLQPCTVYWDDGQEAYVLLVGERRWRAAAHAGLTDLLCIIMERRPDPRERLTLQLIENLLREDLAPVEQARAYQEMMRLNDWGTNQLARELHIPPSAVSQALSLLELPAPIQDRIDAGEMAASVGYELSKLSDPAHQAQLAGRVAAEGLTREETVAEVRRLRSSGGERRAAGRRGRTGPRKPTRRIFKHDGIKIILECKRGLDRNALMAAIETVLSQVRDEGQALDAA
jgi:ParB family transcriptional regulator, chromosome partitioning protein